MPATVPLPTPEPGRGAAEAFVAEHLADLACDDVVGSERLRGGQAAADAALAAFDVTGYARARNEVHPDHRRGASGLSPYIRHGLLPLRRVWEHVADGPSRDVAKFRDELLWQEYARHWYARLGTATRRGIKRELPFVGGDDDWDRSMACIAMALDELERDGWLVNQTRMWLASHWSVRDGQAWRAGEDAFFRHLVDGSRAANRLGWQWTTGVGSAKPYGFSRWQVEKRAPGLCRTCPHARACPIQEWPDDPSYLQVDQTIGAGENLIGPTVADGDPSLVDVVWLTAESLGDEDPAADAHPAAPLVFVFDRPLLEALQLSAKRLVFLVETLAETATHRTVELHLGRPAAALEGRSVAVTHAPVPGFAHHRRAVQPAIVHPWPWLVAPTSPKVSSFTAWRKANRRTS